MTRTVLEIESGTAALKIIGTNVPKTKYHSMSENTENLTDQMGAFQKIWMDAFSRMAQSAFSFTPDSAPPEMLRQMRSGFFQALAQSWNEYLRSPQFMEGMRQCMDNAILFRKMTDDLLSRARHDTQGLAREDIDSVMLAVRHMETRILDRLEVISARVDELSHPKANGATRNASKRMATTDAPQSQTTTRNRSRKNVGSKQPKSES